MARKKTTPGHGTRARARGRLETTWKDAREALRSAEGVVGSRVAAFARSSGIDTKELAHRAEPWRSRIDREGKKARKRASAGLAELQQRAQRERKSAGARRGRRRRARARRAQHPDPPRGPGALAPRRAASPAGSTRSAARRRGRRARCRPLGPAGAQSARRSRSSAPAAASPAPSTRSAACGRSTSSSAASSATSTSTSASRGGAFVASLLAAGVSPREMYDEAILPSRGTLGAASAAALPLERPRVPAAHRPGAAGPRASRCVTSLPAKAAAGATSRWSLFELLPAGLLDDGGDPGVPGSASSARAWAPIASTRLSAS